MKDGLPSRTPIINAESLSEKKKSESKPSNGRSTKDSRRSRRLQRQLDSSEQLDNVLDTNKVPNRHAKIATESFKGKNSEEFLHHGHHVERLNQGQNPPIRDVQSKAKELPTWLRDDNDDNHIVIQNRNSRDFPHIKQFESGDLSENKIAWLNDYFGPQSKTNELETCTKAPNIILATRDTQIEDFRVFENPLSSNSLAASDIQKVDVNVDANENGDTDALISQFVHTEFYEASTADLKNSILSRLSGRSSDIWKSPSNDLKYPNSNDDYEEKGCLPNLSRTATSSLPAYHSIRPGTTNDKSTLQISSKVSNDSSGPTSPEVKQLLLARLKTGRVKSLEESQLDSNESDNDSSSNSDHEESKGNPVDVSKFFEDERPSTAPSRLVNELKSLIKDDMHGDRSSDRRKDSFDKTIRQKDSSVISNIITNNNMLLERNVNTNIDLNSMIDTLSPSVDLSQLMNICIESKRSEYENCESRRNRKKGYRQKSMSWQPSEYISTSSTKNGWRLNTCPARAGHALVVSVRNNPTINVPSSKLLLIGGCCEDEYDSGCWEFDTRCGCWWERDVVVTENPRNKRKRDSSNSVTFDLGDEEQCKRDYMTEDDLCETVTTDARFLSFHSINTMLTQKGQMGIMFGGYTVSILFLSFKEYIF